jgi:hypothetical protein
MATGSQYLSARVTVLGTSASNSTEIMTFTIPSAGTWVINYFITMNQIGVGGLLNCNADLFDSNNTYLANSRITVPNGWNSTAPFTANKTTLITTTGPATFKLKGWGGASYNVEGGGAGVVYVSDSGTQGPAGAKGDKGLTGDRGLSGAVGPTGAIGPAGPAGAKGDKGLTGDRGLPGANGATGPAGAKGDIGAKGDAGPRGYDGAKGANGTQGPAGPAGPAGAKGDTGRNATVYIQTTAPDNSVGATGDIWYQF